MFSEAHRPLYQPPGLGFDDSDRNSIHAKLHDTSSARMPTNKAWCGLLFLHRPANDYLHAGMAHPLAEHWFAFVGGSPISLDQFIDR
jgi:hypothetical protein